MPQRLKGKSAVITGGGNGIGRAVALAMVIEGAQIVINDIGHEPDGRNAADQVVGEILKGKGVAVANYDSVATMQSGENIIKSAISNFGKIDILVNCAGNFMPVRSSEITEEQWDSIMNVHLKGHFSCARAAITEMTKQRSGRIINISSRAASFGGGNPAYSAAKAGILGLTSMMAAELKDFGITVNAILPSADTKLFPGKTRPGLGDHMPASLWMEPDYVAPIIVYLATNEAQGITGRFIYASGGDLCIYARPLQLPGSAHTLVRKMGKWTIDELSEVIPSLIGLS